MKRLLVLIFVLVEWVWVVGNSASAQVLISSGEHALEISGAISGFYNHRFLTESNPRAHIDNNPALGLDKSKNRFALRDMQLQLEGRVGRSFEYEFQVDFADLANTSDPGENPGIMDAFVTWKSFVQVSAGFQKIPFSRNSLVPFAYSPFWQRAEVTRGEVFSRRDVGVVVNKTLWDQKIQIYGGVFSGMGEQVLTVNGGDNDPSGTLELAGRADISWPSRFRYRDYDVNQSPIPMFQAGIGARTVNRKFSSFLEGDDYYLRVIGGRKTCLTGDFSFQWRGISGQAEWHQMQITPTNDIDPSGTRYREERGTKASTIGAKPTSYFRAGGLILNLSYASRKLHSIFAVRYDQLNPNDLVLNNTEESLTFAYAYQIQGFRSMIKAQYNHRLVDRNNPLIRRFDDQLRIGWQYLFQ